MLKQAKLQTLQLSIQGASCFLVFPSTNFALLLLTLLLFTFLLGHLYVKDLSALLGCPNYLFVWFFAEEGCVMRLQRATGPNGYGCFSMKTLSSRHLKFTATILRVGPGSLE